METGMESVPSITQIWIKRSLKASHKGTNEIKITWTTDKNVLFRTKLKHTSLQSDQRFKVAESIFDTNSNSLKIFTCTTYNPYNDNTSTVELVLESMKETFWGA